MIRDPRVHLDPTTRAHYRKIESEEAALDRSLGATSWELVVRPLVDLIGAVIDHREALAPAFPAGGEPRLRAAFDAFASSVVKPEAPVRNTRESLLLSRHVARRTGPSVPQGVDAWVRGARLFHDWIAWTEFIQSVPDESIQRALDGLLRMPEDETNWVDGIGRVRHGDATRDLDEQLASGGDLVVWAGAVERYADNLMLGPDLQVRSHLLARLGGSPWLTWASGLPHPLFAALAANDLYDLDFAQSVLDGLSDTRAGERALLIAAVLVAHRLIELFTQVDRSLASAASMRWTGIPDDASRAEFGAMLNDWRSRELPERIDRLARSLAGRGVATDVGVVVARALRSGQKTEPNIFRLVREQLIAQLGATDPDTKVASLFGDKLGTAGLLAGTLVAVRWPSGPRARTALAAYTRWVTSPEFFWSAPLEADEDDLTEAMGHALALAETPVGDAEALVAAVRVPSQGWGFDLQRWLDAVPRVAHAVIVIAVGAHFTAAAGRQREATAMIRLSVETLTAWLREAPMRYSDPRLTHAVGYTFAFLAKVAGSNAERLVVAALAGFDGLDEIITAAENYARNLDPPLLPLAPQRALRIAFEAQRSILAENPHLSEGDLTRLVDSVRRIAADAYAEAGGL